MGGDLEAAVGVLLLVGRHRHREHLEGLVADALDVDVGEHLVAGLAGVLPQVGGQVGDAFQVGDDFERGGDEPEVACDRLLERQQVDTVLFEVEVEIVHLAIAGDDLLAEFLVLLFEGVEAHPEALGDDLTHVEDVLAERFELSLVLVSWHWWRGFGGSVLSQSGVSRTSR